MDTMKGIKVTESEAGGTCLRQYGRLLSYAMLMGVVYTPCLPTLSASFHAISCRMSRTYKEWNEA